MSYTDYVREHIFKPCGMNDTDNVRNDSRANPVAIGYTRGDATGTGARLVRKDDGSPAPVKKGGPGKKGGPEKKGRPQKQAATPADGPLRSADHLRAGEGTSAGGGYSTVGDLLKFATALTSGRLLDQEWVKVLTSGKIPTDKPGTKYAYGFEEEMSDDGVRRFGHGGGFPGINAGLSVFPAAEYVVVVLANRDSPAAKEVERFIAPRLPRE
jgi:CubicO group peptidase (beta-lactamase class C family)